VGWLLAVRVVAVLAAVAAVLAAVGQVWPSAVISVMLSAPALLPAVDAQALDLLAVDALALDLLAVAATRPALRVPTDHVHRHPASNLAGRMGRVAEAALAKGRLQPPVNDPVTTKPLSWRHGCICRF
jgi:hypothetical protein